MMKNELRRCRSSDNFSAVLQRSEKLDRRQKARQSLALFCLCVWLFPNVAFAYIDPGTGSALVYVVTGLVVSLYFGLRSFYYRVGEWVLRSRHRVGRCDLALHSEAPHYEITFLPVLRALSARGVPATYLTMYERGEGFEELPAGISHTVIPQGMVGYALLNNLTAVVLATTTPQLDVMTFRRSKRVKHYANIPHALGEARYSRPYAYDFYDSVFCCGPILKQNIRRMEELRGLPAKRLFDVGIPHYDELLKGATRRTGSRPTVLIAPSWGPLSIFECFGTEFLKQLLGHYDVLVRPHPQLQRSNPTLYESILAFEGIEVNKDRTPMGALARADILVSDISGIVHEAAFIFERPVIIVDQKLAAGGLEGELLGGDSDLKERCRDIIIPFAPADIDHLGIHVERALAQHQPKRIAELRSELVYEFGSAGPATARQLESLLECP